ncbi:MAG: hypothetical protein IPM29_31220 [Planctomycetes bacterium]|nr:hypothetical protein [Planctomycetota bacterium]
MLFRLARAFVLLMAGGLLGCGLLMMGQVHSLHYLRQEVRDTFFLWRGIGKITFAWQDDMTKAALWADDIPESVLREWEHGAWAFLALGALAALVAATMRRPKPARRG